MDIATEIQNYAQINYPGIPPANPGGGPLPDSGAYAASESTDKLSPSSGPATITVKSSEGFHVGYTAILDSYLPTTTDAVTKKNVSLHQEAQTITAVPDATHITVERIEKPHDGSQKPFPIMQGGEKGQLIAEWFEYTPTSGTDIAVTSNLTTIA